MVVHLLLLKFSMISQTALAPVSHEHICILYPSFTELRVSRKEFGKVGRSVFLKIKYAIMLQFISVKRVFSG